MSFTRPQQQEICRTWVDVALRLKRTLDEPFERVVIQRVLDAAYPVIRTGTIPEMEQVVERLRSVVAMYIPVKEAAR